MRNLKNVWVRNTYAVDMHFTNETWKLAEIPWDMSNRIPKLKRLRDRAYDASWYAFKAAEDDTLSDQMYEALLNVERKANDRYNKLDELVDTLNDMLENMDKLSEQMEFVFDYCKEFTIEGEKIV